MLAFRTLDQPCAPPRGHSELTQQPSPGDDGEDDGGCGRHRLEEQESERASSARTGSPKISKVMRCCPLNSPTRRLRVAITAISSKGMTVAATA